VSRGLGIVIQLAPAARPIHELLPVQDGHRLRHAVEVHRAPQDRVRETPSEALSGDAGEGAVHALGHVLRREEAWHVLERKVRVDLVQVVGRRHVTNLVTQQHLDDRIHASQRLAIPERGLDATKA